MSVLAKLSGEFALKSNQEKVSNAACPSKSTKKPQLPQTNGMVERFNDRIEEILHQTDLRTLNNLKELSKIIATIYVITTIFP